MRKTPVRIGIALISWFYFIVQTNAAYLAVALTSDAIIIGSDSKEIGHDGFADEKACKINIVSNDIAFALVGKSLLDGPNGIFDIASTAKKLADNSYDIVRYTTSLKAAVDTSLQSNDFQERHDDILQSAIVIMGFIEGKSSEITLRIFKDADNNFSSKAEMHNLEKDPKYPDKLFFIPFNLEPETRQFLSDGEVFKQASHEESPEKKASYIVSKVLEHFIVDGGHESVGGQPSIVIMRNGQEPSWLSDTYCRKKVPL